MNKIFICQVLLLIAIIILLYAKAWEIALVFSILYHAHSKFLKDG